MDIKVCEGCGCIIERRECDNDYRWNARKYCTSKCANTKHGLNVKAIVSLYNNGIDMNSIGRIYKISGSLVKSTLERAGIDLTEKPYEDYMRDYMLRNSYIDKNGCWIWTRYINNGGYGNVTYKGSMAITHRVSYEVFIEEVPDELDVCHKCDNRRCINPEHLFLGTRKDNMVDAYNKGRIARGQKLPQTKLTTKEVLEIKKLLKDGKDRKKLSSEYGVNTSTIHAIAQGRNWAWLH